MTYDPRGPYGHQSGGGQPPPPPQPQAHPQLTFGGVFWACFLALTVWSVLGWLIVAALVEQQSNGF